ncbi:MAG: hypothetical protein ACLRPQ_01740 [Streptococcus sp.]
MQTKAASSIPQASTKCQFSFIIFNQLAQTSSVEASSNSSEVSAH